MLRQTRRSIGHLRDDALRAANRRIDRCVPEPVQRFLHWLRSDDFVSTSASLAFYALISLAPMMLVAFWVVGTLVPDQMLQHLGRDVDRNAPHQVPVGDVVRQLVQVASHVGWFAVLGALWPATAYGGALARAFHRITPHQERRVRGWKGRLFALVIIALMPVAVFGGLAMSFLGPRLLPDAGPWLRVLLALGAYAAVAGVVAVIFTLYRFHGSRPRDVLLGAGVTATLIVVASAAYLVYLQLSGGLQDRYGAASLATVVLLGLWLLVVNAMLIVGYRLMLRRARSRDAGQPVESGSTGTPGGVKPITWP